jgi:hypothetical protein
MRGGQRQVLALLQGLSAKGVECSLLARSGSPLMKAALEAGFRVSNVSALNVRRHGRRGDLVHAHDARAHTLAAVTGVRPLVVSRRVAFEIKSNWTSGWKYRRADRYLAVSEFVKGILVRHGIPDTQIDVVYDAVVAQSTARPWSPEYKAVALASLDPLKGRDLVEEAARRSGVAVCFSDALETDLQEASMFLYITRSEGLGSAALLAMSMGVPVIASAVDGLREIFEDGVSGLYVTNEPAAIIRAMRRILSDRALALRLIDAARRRVQTTFSMEQMVEGTLNCYRRVLSD